MDIQYYLTQAVQENASDLHITVGEPPILRIDGELMPVGEVRLSPADTLELTKQATADRFAELERAGELDFSMGIKGLGRFRVNAYRSGAAMGWPCASCITKSPPWRNWDCPRGQRSCTETARPILVTGPTGSGKSTTLASMIDMINVERSCTLSPWRTPLSICTSTRKAWSTSARWAATP